MKGVTSKKKSDHIREREGRGWRTRPVHNSWWSEQKVIDKMVGADVI